MRMLYCAQTIDTAIYETIVRNRFDINPNRFLESVLYEEMSVVSFSNVSSQKLNLLNLTQGRATQFGVPTDVIRSSEHVEGQNFSHFVYTNMPYVDGFVYSSRFTEEECIALYHDRAITKLSASEPVLLNRDIVRSAMSAMNVQV